MANKCIEKYKKSITKSRAGSYTLTIRAVGQWSDSLGRKAPLSEVVFKQCSMELGEAQAAAARFTA